MTRYTKSNLPDPGHDRWWEISTDPDGDFILTLMDDSSWQVGIASSGYIPAAYATTERFEREAKDLLDKIAKHEAFLGTYHKNEEN